MIALFDRLCGPGLWFLADWSLRWGVLIALAAAVLATRLGRRASARHAACTAALVAGLLVPVAPRWGALPPFRSPEPAPAPAPMPLPAPAAAPRPSRTAPPAPPMALPDPGPIPIAPPVAEAPAPPRRPARDFIPLALAAAWAAGVAVLLARRAGAAIVLGRLRRRAVAVADPLLDDCRRAVGLRRAVRLATDPAVASPAVLGGWRPVVLVPPGWADWPEADRRACLLHELAHLARGDDWAKLAQELARVPVFFHPLVAWLLARLDLDRELLCDEAVVAHGASPVAYARLLLDLARNPGRIRREPAWLPFLGRGTVLARIGRLLEDDMPRTPAPRTPLRRAGLGLVAVAALLLAGTAGFRSVAARPKADAPPAADAPAAPKTLQVTVTGPDGRPVAGATVAAGALDRPATRTTLRTDGEGRFTVPIPEGRGMIEYVVHRDGLAPVIGGQEFPSPASGKPQVVKMKEGRPVEGRLVDGDGRPMAGARVRLEGMAGRSAQGEFTWVLPDRVRSEVAAGGPLEHLFEAVTDGEGQFRLADLPARKWAKFAAFDADGRMRLVRSATPPADPILDKQAYVAFPPGSAARLVAVPAARVAGRVTTGLPGVGVAGLKVIYQGSRPRAYQPRPDESVTPANPHGATTTDGDGRFAFDGLVEGTVNVVVRADLIGGPWTYRAAKDVPLEPGRTAEVAIELVRGVEVAGKVVEGDSARPVPGAEVGIYGPPFPRTSAMTTMATTDANGVYRFRLPPGDTYFYVAGLPPGLDRSEKGSSRTVPIPEGAARHEVPPLRLVAADPRKSEGTLKIEVPRDEPEEAGAPGRAAVDGTVRVELAVLARPAQGKAQAPGPDRVDPDAVAGVVVDKDGRPVAGVEADAWHWAPGHVATTGADGRFAIGGLPEKTGIVVRFRKEGYATQFHLDREAGQAGWVVVLGNSSALEGRVLGPDGAPVPNALIRADSGPRRARGFLMSECITEATSGPDGRYRLVAEPAEYDIAIRAPGVGVFRRKGVVEADRVKAADLRLEPGIPLEIRLVDAETKRPVPGVLVKHWDRPGVEGTSDADGRIRIPDLTPGMYPEFQVDGNPRGYARWWSVEAANEFSRLQKEPGRFQRNFDDLGFEMKAGMGPVTVAMERGVKVRGRVVDPDGRPVAGATVAPANTGSGNSLTGDTRFSVETDAQGRFEALLPASGEVRYNLVAHDGKYGEWRNWANGTAPPIRTAPGQEIDGVELALTRPGVVSGRVVDARGKPAAGVEVRAEPTARDENRYYDPTTTTGPDGTFTLRWVRPGENFVQAAPFWLDAKDAPKGTSRVVAVEPGGEARDVDLLAKPDR